MSRTNARSGRPLNIVFRLLGPGLVTGAADDDPSGIATYSQAGAQFGFGLLWTVFLTTPFMIAIQLVSAHIGRVTGKGIAAKPAMKFRPTYDGEVRPTGGTPVGNQKNPLAEHKHHIRRQFHGQLKQFWNTDLFLRE